MSKKQEPKVEAKGLIISISPKDEGYVGIVMKDGKVIHEIANPTLYHAVAGQLRRYLDLGLSL